MIFTVEEMRSAKNITIESDSVTIDILQHMLRNNFIYCLHIDDFKENESRSCFVINNCSDYSVVIDTIERSIKIEAENYYYKFHDYADLQHKLYRDILNYKHFERY